MNKAHSVDMAQYYARRANEYELVYLKPERQDELRALEVRWTDHTHYWTLSYGLS